MHSFSHANEMELALLGTCVLMLVSNVICLPRPQPSIQQRPDGVLFVSSPRCQKRFIRPSLGLKIVCLCVCEREGERQRVREQERDSKSQDNMDSIRS